MVTREQTIEVIPRFTEWSLFENFLREAVYLTDSTTEAIIPWQWWPVHNEMVALLEERLLVILKARQVSWSWLLAAYAVHGCLYRPQYTVLVFSKGQDEASEFLRKCKVVWQHLPDWLRPRLPISNSEQMLFDVTKGRILAMPSTETAGIGYTASLIITDEAASHPYAAQNYTAYSPAIDAGGQHIMVSTAKGWGNLFEKMYHAAQRGLSSYRAHFFGWRVRPGRDAAWYEERRLNLLAAGQGDTLAQEYPDAAEEAFLVSGRPRFKTEVILKGLEEAKAPLRDIPEKLRHIPGLSIWKLPVPGQPYCMGSDPAEGLPHGDWSVTQVLLARTKEHVATIKGHFEPGYFTQISAEVGIFYNTALWGWERNNHGHTMTEVADKQLHYPRMYQHPQAEQTMRQRREGILPQEKYGFPTTVQTRPKLIDDLAAVVDTYTLVSPSQSLWNEARTFIIDENGKARGADGTTDDEIIALGLANHVANQPGATSMRDIGEVVPALAWTW